ncbi:hypothetical protein BD310DRAFT_917848 [Dichomitus squalens]|uniref:CFA20 domain-containing protein n=1 Tax=Dichomitus squalens TaxID=114155 RepID=A0A4Q9Q5H9_9APHY|nr:hypothetical protein BD310DRAFT_917848 [Dichomitus squalens]
MFSSSVQPSLVSLFSSTGSDPLGLFQTHTDSTLPADSVICLLNDTTSQPVPPPPQTLITATGLEDDTAQSPNYNLDQTVLHLQSPTLRTTYIRCPPAAPAAPGKAGSRAHLGLKHAWMHLQVRNMGREWAFEVGVVDRSGREGVVRCSTFQVRRSSPQSYYVLGYWRDTVSRMNSFCHPTECHGTFVAVCVVGMTGKVLQAVTRQDWLASETTEAKARGSAPPPTPAFVSTVLFTSPDIMVHDFTELAISPPPFLVWCPRSRG